MNEEEQEKFKSDQVEAARLAKEILDKEEKNTAADAIAFALNYHSNVTVGTPPTPKDVIKTAKIFKQFLDQ